MAEMTSYSSSSSTVLSLLLLAGLVSSLTTTLIEPPANKMIHDMMDAIESGMKDPVEDVEGKGRNFWLVSVTLTSTSTLLETDTTTITATPSCVDGVFMECTEMPATTPMAETTTMEATTMSVPRRKNKNKNKNKRNKNKRNKNKKKKKHHGSRNEEFLDLVSDIYRGAMVTDEYGVERDISVLLSGQARSAASDLTTVETEDVEEFYMRNVCLPLCLSLSLSIKLIF